MKENKRRETEMSWDLHQEEKEEEKREREKKVINNRPVASRVDELDNTGKEGRAGIQSKLRAKITRLDSNHLLN